MDPSEFLKQWSLVGIVIVPISKQEALRCKNGCFCYLYMDSLVFIWFWWCLFLMNSLENLFQKNIYHYYVATKCIIIFVIKEWNFLFLTFLGFDFNAVFFCKMIIFIGYWWTMKFFLILFWKGVQNPKCLLIWKV